MGNSPSTIVNVEVLSEQDSHSSFLKGSDDTKLKERFYIKKKIFTYNTKVPTLQEIGDKSVTADTNSLALFDKEFDYLKCSVNRNKMSEKITDSKSSAHLKGINNFLQKFGTSNSKGTENEQRITNKSNTEDSICIGGQLDQNKKQPLLPENNLSEILQPQVFLKPVFLESSVAEQGIRNTKFYQDEVIIPPVFGISKQLKSKQITDDKNFAPNISKSVEKVPNDVSNEITHSLYNETKIKDDALMTDYKNAPENSSLLKNWSVPNNVQASSSSNTWNQPNIVSPLNSKSNSHRSSEINQDDVNEIDIILLGAISKFESVLKRFQGRVLNDNELIIEKLNIMQGQILMFINNLANFNNNNNNNVAHWIQENIKSDKHEKIQRMDDNDDEDSSSDSSFFSISNTLEYPYTTRVNCQFCNKTQSDIFILLQHIQQNCTALKSHDLKSSTHKEYSFFYLLPNKKIEIKCALCKVICHRLSEILNHASGKRHCNQVKNLMSKKMPVADTSFIYCIVCKVFVPDNMIQFNQHMSIQEHIDNCSAGVRRFKILNDGVSFSLESGSVCCCLVCGLNFDYNVNYLKQHPSHPLHENSLQQVTESSVLNYNLIYCNVCQVIVDIGNVGLHQNAEIHLRNCAVPTTAVYDFETSMKSYYCVFCNERKQSIQTLAQHQSGNCVRISELKNEYKLDSVHAMRLSDLGSPIELNVSAGIEEDSNSYCCLLCDFQTSDSNYTTWNQHIISEKHKALLAEFAKENIALNYWQCLECKVTFYGEKKAFEHHKLLKQHKNKPEQHHGVPDESSTKKENMVLSIMVKGIPGFWENKRESLINCFKSFGPVATVNLIDSSSAVITFGTEYPVAELLQMSNITIGGVSLEILPVEKMPTEPPTLKKTSVAPNITISPNLVKFFTSEKLINTFAEELCRLSDRMKTGENVEVALLCQSILQTDMYYIYGSRGCNLSFPNSDLNIFFDIFKSNLYYAERLQTPEEQGNIMTWVRQTINKSGKLRVLEEDLNAHVPSVTCLYSNEKNADLVVTITLKNGLVDLNTQLIKYFVSYNHNIRAFLLLIRFWFKEHGLIGKGLLNQYALTWMAIFFLQQAKVVPVLEPDRQIRTNSNSIQGWNTSMKMDYSNVKRITPDVACLVFEFLEYYINFDFSKYVIFTSLSKTVEHSQFKLILLQNGINLSDAVLKEFDRKQTMVITDPFEVDCNITKDLDEQFVSNFKALCQMTFQLLPKK